MEKKSQTPNSAKLKNSPPHKPKNKDQRTREYLTETEVDQLRQAARQQGRQNLSHIS